MFDRQALRSFVTTLEVNTSRLNAEQAQALLVRTAQSERDRVLREQGARGSTPAYRQIVDGILGAPLEAVKPDGVIVFEWQYLREIVSELYDLLVQRSPRDDGTYIESIQLLLDGREGTLEEIDAETRVIHIVPTAPYSRRLEVGRRKDDRPFVIQVQPHIVQEIAMAGRRLFGQVADVSLSYITLSDGYILKGGFYGTFYFKARKEGSFRDRGGMMRRSATRQARGKEMTYPAIEIEARR